MTIHGFPAIAAPNIMCLILGTMPSVASLQAGRYYGHPRNQFWPILADIFQWVDLDYADRCVELCQQRIGVWDVLQSCIRPGSLDSAIDPSSIQINDFKSFLEMHSSVSRLYFNGAKAEQLFRSYALKQLPSNSLRLIRLPSTSPAHASITLEQKIAAWHRIKDELNL